LNQLQREDRTLKPLTDLPQIPEAVLNVASVVDPEKPVALADLVKIFNPDAERAAVTTRGAGPAWTRIAAVAVVVAALTALWKFTPLADLLDARQITAWAREFGGQWWAPLLTMLAYTPAAATMFPRPLITLFAVIAFGPWMGFVYAMLGIELSAWATYVAGKQLDRDTVRRVALDTSSRTSVALVKVLCRHRFQIEPQFVTHRPDLESMTRTADAALLIGDPALEADPAEFGLQKIDLGAEWTAMTGLPFVYAAWTGRPDAVTAADVQALQAAQAEGVRSTDAIAAEYGRGNPTVAARAAAYLRDNVKYGLGPAEIAGLQMFLDYAADVNAAPRKRAKIG
jgi:predicted solute-binding protein